MPISCPGKISAPFQSRDRKGAVGCRGVTLLEMVSVVAIIGVMAGLVFPGITSGLDSIRLSTATDAVATFFNSALNRAERRQQVVEIVISVKENFIRMYSSEPGFERKLDLPDGIKVESVLPAADESQDPRFFLVQPGGTVPRIGVALANRRGARRLVRVDPMTGVPRIEAPEAQ